MSNWENSCSLTPSFPDQIRSHVVLVITRRLLGVITRQFLWGMTTDMISFQQALQKIDSLATPFSIEQVGLLDALGRVLAENMYADRDYPPFNRAAMDGIGISSKQWHAGARSFQVRQTVFAGMQPNCQLQEGECFRIMTGAACPPQVIW